MKLTFVLAVALLLGACSSVQTVRAPTGSWYTEGVEDGIHAQFKTSLMADGTFHKDIRDSTDCRRPISSTESGRWRLNGDTLLLVTDMVGEHKVDATNPEFNDTFTLAWLDTTHITIYDIKTRITWAMQRVDASFKFPMAEDCAV